MDTLSFKILKSRKGVAHIFSVGQAGFIIKSASGQILGIDLYLSECVEELESHIGFKRLLPQILQPEDIVFDVLIATHPHYDHFDVDAMPKLMGNAKTRLFASVECAKEVKKLQMSEEKITYVKPHETYISGDFEITFTNCDHGEGAPDAVGVLIRVDGKTILEVGDTALRLDYVDEYLSKGKLDILIAPINGAYGNLNENECVKLSSILNPKITIPCHYGMFALHGGNLKVFVEKMDELNNNYILMCQGDAISLNNI